MAATLTRERQHAPVEPRPRSPEMRPPTRTGRSLMATVVVAGLVLVAVLGWFAIEGSLEPLPADDVTVVDDYTRLEVESEALWESLGMRWDF